MAIDNLTEEIEAKSKELEARRANKYPLLDIVTNRKEIREISENTMEYLSAMYPNLVFSRWEIIPRIVIEFHKEINNYLEKEMSSDVGNVSIKLGDFVTIGVEQTRIEGADLEGTINPKIEMGPEMYYDNENPDNNKLKMTIPEIEVTSTLENICVAATKTLDTKYTVVLGGDWTIVYKVVLCFYRIVRDYLINHKNDNGDDLGLIINVASIIKFIIEARDITPPENITDEGDHSPENTWYVITMTPEVMFKLTNKSNDKTEK